MNQSERWRRLLEPSFSDARLGRLLMLAVATAAQTWPADSKTGREFDRLYDVVERLRTEQNKASK